MDAVLIPAEEYQSSFTRDGKKRVANFIPIFLTVLM